MRLLFDQNLSPVLVARLADCYPESVHVQSVGLACATDDEVWEYARLSGLVIVTKDVDYNNLSVVRGSPPKVLWLLLGNSRTAQVEALLRARQAEIEEFGRDDALGTLLLGVGQEAHWQPQLS